MQTISRYITAASLLLLTLTYAGCKKLVEPSNPTDKINVSVVYASNNTAASVLTRLMSDMQNFAQYSQGIPITGAVAADDLKAVALTDVFQQSVYTNNMTKSTLWWGYCYNYIYVCNDAIEQLNISTGVTDSVKRQLIGEAKFLRAFSYFYLVNFFGDVPLALTTDYHVNSLLSRAPTAQVYQQIIRDLLDARDLLNSKYLNYNIVTTTVDHVRPTKAAAGAMLARAYLYTGDYVNAEKEATNLISNPVYGLPNIDSAFLKNNREAIWQMAPATAPYNNTMDAVYYIFDTAPDASRPFTISDILNNAFETGDLRSSHWVGTKNGFRFPYKYKSYLQNDPSTEYIMVLRLGEQYLIRAEARIRQNNVAAGIADLNTLRARARGSNPGDLPDLSTGLSQADAQLAVEHERQVELFTEWGHRWLDLKRTGRIDAVMTQAAVYKGSTWNPLHALFMIPASEILNAPGLSGHQNPGY